MPREGAFSTSRNVGHAATDAWSSRACFDQCGDEGTRICIVSDWADDRGPRWMEEYAGFKIERYGDLGR